jgi:hypothetical protein
MEVLKSLYKKIGRSHITLEQTLASFYFTPIIIMVGNIVILQYNNIISHFYLQLSPYTLRR